MSIYRHSRYIAIPDKEIQIALNKVALYRGLSIRFCITFKKTAQAVTRLTYIRDVLDSKRGRRTFYAILYDLCSMQTWCVFSQPFRQIPQQSFKQRNDRFFPHPSQFTVGSILPFDTVVLFKVIYTACNRQTTVSNTTKCTCNHK